MGTLLTLLSPGERVGDVVIPEGKVGIGTICCIGISFIFPFIIAFLGLAVEGISAAPRVLPLFI